MNTLNWIATNWVEIGAAVALIFASARIIVKLTPTQADDALLAKLVPVIEFLALHIKPKK